MSRSKRGSNVTSNKSNKDLSYAGSSQKPDDDLEFESKPDIDYEFFHKNQTYS